MSESELTRILIETPIDQLIELIRQKRKMALSKAAAFLNVSDDQLEEWVKILEDKGYLRLMYPPVGEPYIILGELPPGKLEPKIRELEKKKEKLGQKTKEMEGKISEVEEVDQNFVISEEELYKHLEEVEANLRSLDELEGKRKSIIAGAKELEEYAKKATENIDKVKENLKELDKKIKQKLEELKGHGDLMGHLEINSLKLEKEMKVLDKEINIVRKLVRAPHTPVLNEFKEILENQKARTSKIKESKAEIQKKTEEIKKEIESKKDELKEKETDHAKSILMELTKAKKEKGKRIKISKVLKLKDLTRR